MGDPELDFLHPPPKGFLKFNIDGASKGNPGKAGHGGVLRDDKGDIIFIFYGHLGKATNNMADLMAMEQCFQFLVQENCHNTIIEADSKLVINSVKRISQGTRLEKANKLADLLANEGVVGRDNKEVMNWCESPKKGLKPDFQNQANEDNTTFLKRAMEMGTINQQGFAHRRARNGVF